MLKQKKDAIICIHILNYIKSILQVAEGALNKLVHVSKYLSCMHIVSENIFSETKKGVPFHEHTFSSTQCMTTKSVTRKYKFSLTK